MRCKDGSAGREVLMEMSCRSIQGLELFLGCRIIRRQSGRLPPCGSGLADTAAIPKGISQVKVRSRVVRAMPSDSW